MSKEGDPAVYEAKGNEHIRHTNKTAQDKLPVTERPRYQAWLKMQKKENADVAE